MAVAYQVIRQRQAEAGDDELRSHVTFAQDGSRDFHGDSLR